MLTTMIAQIIRFARPNIQIYDVPVVDLYQWGRARYLVRAKGGRYKSKTRLSSALDRISERITLASNPKISFGGQLSKNEIHIKLQ